MSSAIAAPRPGDNHALVPLEHDDRRAPKNDTVDSGVGVTSCTPKVTKDGVVCNDVRCVEC